MTFEVGDRVAIRHTSGGFSLGEISRDYGNKYEIIWDDGFDEALFYFDEDELIPESDLLV